MIQYLKHQKTALSERILDLTERLRHLEEGANVTVQSEVTTVKAVDTGLRDELIEVRIILFFIVGPKKSTPCFVRPEREAALPGAVRAGCNQGPVGEGTVLNSRVFFLFWGKVFHRSFSLIDCAREIQLPEGG